MLLILEAGKSLKNGWKVERSNLKICEIFHIIVFRYIFKFITYIKMKRLYLFRHAKSDWDEVVDSDIARPLNPRWEFDAALIWKVFAKRNIVPDKIYCSSAIRASQTLEIFLKYVPYPKDKVFFDDFLYNLHWVNNLQEIKPFIDYIKRFPDYYKDVMIVWHNDGLSFILQYLTQEKIDISTWWLVCIALWVDSWSNISEGLGEIYFYDKPSNFKNFEKNIVLSI